MNSSQRPFVSSATLPSPENVAQFLSILRKEEERRRLGEPVPQQPSRWAKYEADPVGFITTSLREYVWSKQREICEAVVKYPRVAVKSCHESGKSFIAGRIPCWWIAAQPL